MQPDPNLGLDLLRDLFLATSHRVYQDGGQTMCI
jgi:hypothetical protein